MPTSKLSICIHNPNTAEATAAFLLEVFLKVNFATLEDSLRKQQNQ